VSQQMEARLPSRVKAACDRVFKALDEVDPDNDCDAFIAEHTGADHYGRASVSSLTNSTKTSRVMKRRTSPKQNKSTKRNILLKPSLPLTLHGGADSSFSWRLLACSICLSLRPYVSYNFFFH